MSDFDWDDESAIRSQPYYGGAVKLDPDPDGGPRMYVLTWRAFEGGKVELDLDDEELSRLRDRITELLRDP